jgi:hypothetical protein
MSRCTKTVGICAWDWDDGSGCQATHLVCSQGMCRSCGHWWCTVVKVHTLVWWYSDSVNQNKYALLCTDEHAHHIHNGCRQCCSIYSHPGCLEPCSSNAFCVSHQTCCVEAYQHERSSRTSKSRGGLGLCGSNILGMVSQWRLSERKRYWSCCHHQCLWPATSRYVTQMPARSLNICFTSTMSFACMLVLCVAHLFAHTNTLHQNTCGAHSSWPISTGIGFLSI